MSRVGKKPIPVPKGVTVAVATGTTGRSDSPEGRAFKSVAEAAALGAWWPFVLMTVLVWGLLPRILLLLFGAWRRRLAATAAWFLAVASCAVLRLGRQVEDRAGNRRRFHCAQGPGLALDA